MLKEYTPTGLIYIAVTSIDIIAWMHKNSYHHSAHMGRHYQECWIALKIVTWLMQELTCPVQEQFTRFPTGKGNGKLITQDPSLQVVFAVQSLSHVQFFVTPWTAACHISLSFTISWSLLKLMSIELVCHPTISSCIIPFSSCLQSFPESGSLLMSQLFAPEAKVLELQLQHQSFQ